MASTRRNPFSQNIQWKVIKSIHDTTHLGRDSFTSLISRSFNGKGLSKTIEQITSCLTSFNNPQGAQKPHLIQPVQHRRVFPGEDWQMDFTQMPPFQGHKYLRVSIDIFTGWIEAFPTQTEKTSEVAKKLLHEIVPRFGLPLSLQSDNGSAFISSTVQLISKALGTTTFTVLEAPVIWSRTANQLLKDALRKLTQGASINWKEALPISLHTKMAPKATLGFSPFEAFYGRPFLHFSLLLDCFYSTQIKCHSP